MKKKNTRAEGKQPDALKKRRELALSRLQARRRKQTEGAVNERAAVFERRLKNAPARKAPLTSHTRGYYRFAREFPGEADGEGLRDNAGPQRRSAKRVILLALGLAAAFLAGFCVTKAAWLSSTAVPGEALTSAPAEEAAAFTSALHFTPAEIENATAAGIARALQNAGCDTAVIEYKDVYGATYTKNAEFVKAVHAQGCRMAAYISCFKDTYHTRNDASLAVQVFNGGGAAWVDNGGSGWLNPFSSAARTLLLGAVRAAAADGFDFVLLDNVCFPTDSGSTASVYPGESEYVGTRNQLLRGFINDAVSAAAGTDVILLTRFTAFDPNAPADRAPAYGDLLGTGAALLCVDARFSSQQKNMTVGAEKFSDPADIPYAFVLAVGEFAVTNAGDAGVLVCLEKGVSLEEALKGARSSGAKGCILW